MEFGFGDVLRRRVRRARRSSAIPRTGLLNAPLIACLRVKPREAVAYKREQQSRAERLARTEEFVAAIGTIEASAAGVRLSEFCAREGAPGQQSRP
jgi:hypothetical protein